MDRVAAPSRTAIVWTVAAIVVALAAAAGAAGSGTAAPFTYVALGDSYSSGEGISPFLGNACHRSSRAYPTWVRRPGAAKTLYATASGGGRPGVRADRNTYGSDRNVRSAGGVSWASWACSGARTANVLPRSLGGVPQQRLGETLDRATQLDSADLARADLVTLTIGGNDAGFIEVLLVCALSNCNTRAFEQGRAAIIDATRPQLEKVYRAVARKAPRARILVLGYPGMFPGAKAEQACAALSRFRGEQTMLRRLGDRLNGTIATAVRTVARSGARVEYVPVSARFAGHEVCGSKGPWLNGLVTSDSGLGLDAASFHPNLEGQRDGYAGVVSAALARGR
jgi:lysophospholipase L1-like esterase